MAKFIFNGMNNITDPAAIDCLNPKSSQYGQWADLCNVDVGDDNSISIRSGYQPIEVGIDKEVDPITGVITSLEVATSLWSNNTISFCVMNSKICSFNGTAVTELEGTAEVPGLEPGDPPLIEAGIVPDVLPNCEFIQVNDVVMFSDSVVTGIISGNIISTFESSNMPTTDEEIEDHVAAAYPAALSSNTSNFDIDTFEFPTPAGTCLEFYNGAVYFAINNFIYCTKTFDIEHVDIRANVVAGYPDNVTMIKKVDDGLYVGTTKGIYFLQGAGIQEGFTQRQIANKGAIYNTAINVQADYVPAMEAKGIAVMWASPLGIFCGINSGIYKNLSENTVALPGGGSGSAMFIESNGQYKYLCSWMTVTNAFTNRYESDFLDTMALEALQVWSINTITTAHSRYTNYPVTSLARYNNKYYGTTIMGICELAGSNDNGAGIAATALSPSVDFRDKRIKFLSALYLSSRGNGEIAVDLYINEQPVFEDEPGPFDDDNQVHSRSFPAPQGIDGVFWQFKIKNVNGSIFQIFSLEPEMLVSTRRTR